MSYYVCNVSSGAPVSGSKELGPVLSKNVLPIAILATISVILSGVLSSGPAKPLPPEFTRYKAVIVVCRLQCLPVRRAILAGV